MSPEQRLIELTLLGIRWSLIHSGVNGHAIKIRQSRIFVNNKLYCTGLGSTFRPTCTSLDNPIESWKHQPLWVIPTCDKVVLNHTDTTINAHPTSAILSKDSGISLSCDWLFSCLSFIFRSLMHKLSSFQSFVYSSPFKVIGVVETCFTSSIFDNKILPSEFSILRKDRPTRGGGVFWLFPCTFMPDWSLLLPTLKSSLLNAFWSSLSWSALHTPPLMPL